MATWQERVQAEFEQQRAKARKKRYVKLKHLGQRKDSFGRWIRNGRRVDPNDRDIVRISIPGELANRILAEAQDANYPYSRLIVVLALLGLPVFQEARDQLLRNQPGKYIPGVVETIVAGALKKKPGPTLGGWRINIEEQLKAASIDRKKKRAQADPTEIALRHFRGED